LNVFFDIGANRGDATVVGLEKGYKVIALEPAPRIYKELVSNFIYNPNVILLKLAVSDTSDEVVEFYEAQEDGLSSLKKAWLTDETMPYNGKPFRTIKATTITIDVEGAEWVVLRGMTRKMGVLTFEWTQETLDEHEAQLKYLEELGYEFFAPQFIEHHLQEPLNWYPIGSLKKWVSEHSKSWVAGGWKESNLRPTADVGMVWVR
jgi:FkbM family methyltransferase